MVEACPVRGPRGTRWRKPVLLGVQEVEEACPVRGPGVECGCLGVQGWSKAVLLGVQGTRGGVRLSRGQGWSKAVLLGVQGTRGGVRLSRGPGVE